MNKESITELSRRLLMSKEHILNEAIEARIGAFNIKDLKGRLEILTRVDDGTVIYFLDQKPLVKFEPVEFSSGNGKIQALESYKTF